MFLLSAGMASSLVEGTPTVLCWCRAHNGTRPMGRGHSHEHLPRRVPRAPAGFPVTQQHLPVQLPVCQPQPTGAPQQKSQPRKKSKSRDYIGGGSALFHTSLLLCALPEDEGLTAPHAFHSRVLSSSLYPQSSILCSNYCVVYVS